MANTVTLFSHGIADTYKQAYIYAKTSAIYTPFMTFNYPDATERFYRVDFRKTSFGQKNEIAVLRKAYEKTLNIAQEKFQCDDPSVILYGLSRGASNLIIFAGTHDLPHVKALILESPYYSMGDVIDHIMDTFNMTRLPHSLGELIMENIFWLYNRNGIKPCDVLENIPKDLPILIICSKKDTLVPFTTSQKLYEELIKTGHKNVHFFITDYGRHGKILHDHNQEKYITTIHTFYKQYNLPYDRSIDIK